MRFTNGRLIKLSTLFNSLWAKITFAIVFLVLIMAAVSYYFGYRELKEERQQVRQRMDRIAKQIASIRMAETEGWYVYQNYIDGLIRADFNKDIVYIAIFDEHDSLAAYTLNSDWIDSEETRLNTRYGRREIVRNLAGGMIAEESRHDLDSIPVQIQQESQSLGTVDVGFSLID